MKKLITIVLLACTLCVQAQEWHTMFAYNNVTQIAMSEDDVYAISDGSLYSVNKRTEQLTIYENLHSTGISCIYYDEGTKQLLIAYKTGKIDLMSDKGVQYVGDLYDKDMVQQKTIYNVTVQGHTAYLSTHYGVQTFDLRTHQFVDSYWLRPDGAETTIKDVLIANDSIYAFSADSMFCAALRDNLVDYTYWKRERYGRVTPDEDKGKHYQDETDHWYAGGAEGIVRFTPTERLTYRPLGPLNNTPYNVTTVGTKLFAVSGGRWSDPYKRPGVVMIYEDGVWTNISQGEITEAVGTPVLDFMNVAVDPSDNEHFFVTSFGTGLYEFQENHAVNKFIAADDNALTSAVPSLPEKYTNLDFALYDSERNLWLLNALDGGTPLVCLTPDGEWHSLPILINGSSYPFYTPGGLLLDNRHSHYKWLATARYNTQLFLLDDAGTPFDASDDRAIGRNTWLTPSGHQISINEIRAMIQDLNGRIWLGTEQGIVIVDTVDYFTSDACLRPELIDDNGENPLESLRVTALCLDTGGRIWAGTETMGVYVLNDDATEIIAHYTTDNSPMLSNNILSLACDVTEHVYVGTAEGLLSWKHKESTGNLDQKNNNEELNMGSMQQWRLHLSYANPQQIVASPNQIFALANGSLFSVDKSTNEITYWSKETGLTGTSVAHIAYDVSAGKLIIAYESGLIDILDNDGNVKQMPDVMMKSGSISTTVNSLYNGSKYVYAAMPFGILAIDSRKAEISDTYYIGENGASIDVQQVVELGDSLYAFSNNKLYKAALKDNLVDYSFWHSETLPFEQVSKAVSHNNRLYVLAENILYQRVGGAWETVVSSPLEWIHASETQLLTYQPNVGLMQVTDKGELKGLSNQYVATDAICTNGEYWLAEEKNGVVHLQTSGDDIFQPAGPMSNLGYHLDIANDRVYVAPGGRWATMFGRMSDLSIYDGQEWLDIPNTDTWYYTNHPIRDAVQYAVDPNDPGHFFVATYGTGVFEFKDYKGFKHYDSSNSTLLKAASDVSDRYYTCTDGAMMDNQGNLWVLNSTALGNPVHLLKPNGQWYSLPLNVSGQNLLLNTPIGIWIDKRNSHWKWLMSQRSETRLILFDDGGTPTNSSDDRCMARTSFVDQNGKNISPANFRCFAQDYTNRIWIGTDKGIITIPSSIDFFTSNSCRRIIIPRNDGTGLGDYLLGDEQINCFAVDGGNRMWIGTENSGLYLIEDDTITVAHFTENNSLLPSNSIQSIAIMPRTGEVFVGTSRGIASYRGDASEAQPDMSGAYAFPNPVRPNYGGVISIAGLMENTVVNIIDSGGNLVCKTRSHGGLAVWDGNLLDGRRATAGVYTALCNAEGGHTVVKVLVIR